MAYERLSDEKIIGSDLEAFIDGAVNMYKRQLTARNADDEIRFQKLVLSENLSFDDQLKYRKDQLKRASDDPDERRRIIKEIATLEDLVEQKAFSDAYNEKLVSYEAGMTSVDAVVDWLKDRLSKTTDLSIQSSIKSELLTKEKEKFTASKNIIKNQTEYALQDRTESILNNQISKVSSERNKALLSGNNELASVYDLQLQSLNKTKTEVGIENDIRNFAVSTITGSSTATGLLDNYNSKISSANTNTPVTINGTTYSSAREYWTYRRDSYVVDTSASGFLTRFNTEQNNSIKTKNSQEILTNNDISISNRAYDSLLSRSELQPISGNIAIYKQDSIQSATDLLATKIYNRYLVDYDVNKALNELENIKANGGANTQSIYTQILTKATEIKTGQVSGITTRAAEISPTGEATPETVTQASKEGAGGVISPVQATSKTAEEIAQEAVKGKETQTFGTDTRTTATGKVAPAAPPIVPAQTPAQITPPLALNKTLDFGTTDPQVKALQQFLNKQGFSVAEAGKPGSVGAETEYFGPATQEALKKFQASQGIVSSGTPITTGYGRLGPQTLAAINKLLNK